MARMMQTAGYSKYPKDPKSKEKTRLDRQGQRILDKARAEGQVQKNSCPRPEIVKELLAYLASATQLFPGETSGISFCKRFSQAEDVLEFVECAELTRVGYRGHFAMMMLRDEFPSGFFVMETTEQGPRLLCSAYANSFLLLHSSEVRCFFGDSSEYSSELKASLVEYEARCSTGDSLVYDVCKMCC